MTNCYPSVAFRQPGEKRAGKARHEVFDEKMHRAAKEILQLETDLRRAVERGEIAVEYQPIYSLGSGMIEGVEALARWRHSELGNVPPDKFIPLAEEIGLIDRLCEQVLRQSCRDIGLLQNELGPDRPMSLSINLSCRQFAQDSLVTNIRKTLEETTFSARNLRLEITESVFFEHPERAVETLHQLRTLGAEIDIDDFGTGYSSLSYLVKLPISKLKIDRSFVSMIDGDQGSDELVRAIVTLARNLGLAVIAEGVETPSQLEKLKQLRCESGQGYLFAESMSFQLLRNFLRDNDTVNLQRSSLDDVEMVSVIQ